MKHLEITFRDPDGTNDNNSLHKIISAPAGTYDEEILQKILRNLSAAEGFIGQLGVHRNLSKDEEQAVAELLHAEIGSFKVEFLKELRSVGIVVVQEHAVDSIIEEVRIRSNGVLSARVL